MALSERPLLRGAELISGSLSLIGLRAALLVLAALPAWATTFGGLLSGAARQPFYAEISGRLPLVHLLRLGGSLAAPLAAVTLLAIVLALLGEQLLIVGGLQWMSPRPTRRASLWQTVWAEGLPWLATMLRVVLVALLCDALGLLLIAKGTQLLIAHGQTHGWTALTLNLVLPGLSVGADLLWLALVGAWAFWCRVLMIADQRRRVRSAWLLVGRLFWRRPGRAPLFFLAVTLGSQLAAGAVLALWRQAPPTSVLTAWGWAGTWVLGLLLQAWVWHWVLRAALLLYQLPSLDDIRCRPDAPLGVIAGLRRLLRWALHLPA